MKKTAPNSLATSTMRKISSAVECNATTITNPKNGEPGPLMLLCLHNFLHQVPPPRLQPIECRAIRLDVPYASINLHIYARYQGYFSARLSFARVDMFFCMYFFFPYGPSLLLATSYHV